MNVKEYHSDVPAAPGGVSVYVDDEPLDPRNDLVDHSPTGFSWGYGGSGPAQLALAILADLVGDERALEDYQELKDNLISVQPQHLPLRVTEEEVRDAI
jgi:hypothetical protein